MLKHYKGILLAFIFSAMMANTASAQKAYYIDGFHGGVWGHYPDWNTRFMADMVKNHPEWNINIEIEPETWDRADSVDAPAFNDFKALFTDQSSKCRIEYVNPAYGQSYEFNIQGESIINQFKYGIAKVKHYFPTAAFTTYSSEEPCFTSALPQILSSYGIKYASLKNPNTCFGGYTRAHGGELVNWIGPDGTAILAVPRYEVEALLPGSTWQTIAWGNSPEYINAALQYGIKHPIGMTLQDAGWKGGPYLAHAKPYEPFEYTTWRNYFENVADRSLAKDWKVSQEDILVSLVWGSQITQKIAQEVRLSENKIVSTEKLAAMAKVFGGYSYPQQKFDAAWRTLLLSQHHDCWIVPYNGKPGDTWADKVVRWTGFTNVTCDSVQLGAGKALGSGGVRGQFVTLFNTTAVDRNEVVTVPAKGLTGKSFKVINGQGHEVPSQTIKKDDGASVAFKANVPSAGYATYQLVESNSVAPKSSSIAKQADGTYKIETDLYRIIIDPVKGGVIKSIIAKSLNNKEFVDVNNARSFNELRGNFYDDGGFHSAIETPAEISVLEDGPLQVAVQLKGKVDGTTFTQTIKLKQGDPLIDMQLHIDWQQNTGIGEAPKPDGNKWTIYKKPFYDDRNKLLALFPLNLSHQKVYKNAPFDVTESQLNDTFFNSWDSIKNNVLLNWVDVTDGNDQYGMALFSDHTTSYAHGQDFPLGLTIQYSGGGLWGRNYTINGPTDVHYALLPHAGKWDKAGVWTANDKWNEPMMISQSDKKPAGWSRSMVQLQDKGLELTSMTVEGKFLFVRVFNAEGEKGLKHISFDIPVRNAQLVDLNGSKREALKVAKLKNAHNQVQFEVPQFGFRTIKVEL